MRNRIAIVVLCASFASAFGQSEDIAKPYPAECAPVNEFAQPSSPSAWGRFEYLLWSFSGGNLPPLTISGAPGSNVAVAGSPGTFTEFGGGEYLDGYRSGGCITLGAWFSESQRIGGEIQGYWIAGASVQNTDGTPDGSALIASSPFVNALNGRNTAVLVSAPGLAGGYSNVKYKSDPIWGGDALVRAGLCTGPNCWIDGLIGFRAFKQSENLDIEKTIIPLGGGFPPGTVIRCDDHWRTVNSFHGLVLGFECQKELCCWTFTARPTIAVGCMESSVDRSGIFAIEIPGARPSVFPGGVYNLETNIGKIESRKWTVLPALDLQAAREIMPGVRVSVGYSGMYIPDIVRPGDQIDSVVNPNYLPPIIAADPGVRRPAAIFERSSAWLHGFTIGAEFRF